MYALSDSKSWCIPEEELGAYESFNSIASRVVARAQNRIGAATKLGACPKMLVIRGSELYKHGVHPGTDPWHFLPGGQGNDADTSFVARVAQHMIDAASVAINLYGAPGLSMRSSYSETLKVAANGREDLASLHRPLLVEGKTTGDSWYFWGPGGQRRMLLPLAVEVVNHGPPPYVHVCSMAYRYWLKAEND